MDFKITWRVVRKCRNSENDSIYLSPASHYYLTNNKQSTWIEISIYLCDIAIDQELTVNRVASHQLEIDLQEEYPTPCWKGWADNTRLCQFRLTIKQLNQFLALRYTSKYPHAKDINVPLSLSD